MVRFERLKAGLAATALAALTLFGATACDASPTSANAAGRVRAASANSTGSDSVSFEMQIAVSGVAGIEIDMDAEGAYDLKARQMRMVMDVLGQDTETVLDGSTVYVKMPLLGDGWFKQDVDVPAGANPLNGGAQDPTQILSWLKGTGDSVAEVGTDKIRGEEATHYRATLNLRDALNELDGEERAKLEEVLDMLGDDEIDVDVWINGDDLPVRVEYVMAFEKTEAEGLNGAKMTFRMDYFDWGKPVRVEVPDPSEVKDFSEAMTGRR